MVATSAIEGDVELTFELANVSDGMEGKRVNIYRTSEDKFSELSDQVLIQGQQFRVTIHPNEIVTATTID